jgi:sensor histidine kinase regulating citrate/malate metabolism
VLVLGNLIDNSLEAYAQSDLEDRKVVVDLFEDDDSVQLTVIDHAGGIDPAVRDRMFERGVSTKNGQSRGTGLSLVNEIVGLYRGDVDVQSSKAETKIEIQLRKVTR